MTPATPPPVETDTEFRLSGDRQAAGDLVQGALRSRGYRLQELWPGWTRVQRVEMVYNGETQSSLVREVDLGWGVAPDGGLTVLVRQGTRGASVIGSVVDTIGWAVYTAGIYVSHAGVPHDSVPEVR